MLLTGFARLADWPMRVDGKIIAMQVKGISPATAPNCCSTWPAPGSGLRALMILAEEALAKGNLVPLPVEHHVVEVQPASALMPPDRQHLPRVRAFVDCPATGAGRHDLPLS
jgi:DNA-binding transcriptional LysR family regulator